MLQESVGYDRDVCERKCCRRMWVMRGMCVRGNAAAECGL